MDKWFPEPLDKVIPLEPDVYSWIDPEKGRLPFEMTVEEARVLHRYLTDALWEIDSRERNMRQGNV